MSLFSGLLPEEVPQMVEKFDAKLDRVIELLELLLTADLHAQGVPPDEIADLIQPKR